MEKLVRKVAEKLEIGSSVITAALTDLTDLLEQYRLDEIEKQGIRQDKRKILTHEEEQEARLYLSAPNLMERTKEDIGKAGVIGEENSRLLMYLIFTSRKRENPLHIISLGSSGIGKTHLQEKVSALIPEEGGAYAKGFVQAIVDWWEVLIPHIVLEELLGIHLRAQTGNGGKMAPALC